MSAGRRSIIFLYYICVVFDYPAASSSLGKGMQQSACLDGGPPDRSVLGVYVQQVVIFPVFSHTFIPGLSWASTASLPLHFHHSDRRNRAIFRGSADMPVPTEPSSTSCRGNLLQTKQGIELRGGHSVTQSGAVGAQVSLPCSRAERAHAPNTLPHDSKDRCLLVRIGRSFLN